MRRSVWEAWDENTPWTGTAKDVEDGFIHLSAAHQLAGTLAKHYAGQDGLLLCWLEADALPAEALRWEPSRGRALFPHLYAPLRKEWIQRRAALPLVEGTHRLPKDLPAD